MTTLDAGIDLRAHPLLAGAPPSQLDAALAGVAVTRVERGTILARPGDRRPALLLVLEGFLHAYELTDDGGRVLFEVVGPGGFEGVLALLHGLGHFTEAASPACVATLGRTQVDRLLDCAPVARNLASALAERLARREHQLAAAALKDPDLQIAKQLLALADALGDSDGDDARMRVHVTHQQIADMLGIRRETVTIHLHHLARAGAVVLEPNGLRVSRRRLHAVLDRTLRVPRS